MNHDCKENTCPFYAEHQNERARAIAALSPREKQRLEFKGLVQGLCQMAEKRKRQREETGRQDNFAFMGLVESFDPKLASLIRKVETELKAVDDYVTSRTDTKKG